ncbi:hypothetical protein F2P56_013453 [Juglans regia]|uniref:TIR domain-containing protein n=1 Tax=Juglans regia TaxID=51240 RepID=A0A833XQ56_JUGRE|nr:hypothetical protein F2P56_013453 [Juglans regia]
MTSSIAFPGLYSSSPSSDSSSSTCQWSYDVFLSFRGEDTRNNFTAHLCSALYQKGINTYIDDDQLKRGEEISSALVKAIEESRISIVILSENYASSTWCLEELIKILECKESKQQIVLPVFYKVDPSIVRHQKSNFEESLAKHEDRLKDEGKVKKWRTALKQVASISGWHLGINGYDQLMMHDLLEDMGKEIVRKESPEEPGRRSRLWFHEDIRYVLEENTGTNQIEGILIDLPRGDRMIRLSPKVFTKMKRLRLFINRNARFCGRLNYLSNELRVIDWPHYPLHSLPSNFHGEKLVDFRMPRSLIKKIDEGLFFKNLTAIDFHGCESLTKISDLSSSSSLKELILDDCRNLVELHDSVGFLDKLEKLSLDGCSNLESLPRRFKLRSLKQLNLEGCPSLQNFPEIECEMGHLKAVLLNETVIEELPSSIKYLSGLQELSLKGCKSLVHLPGSIFQLQHLEELWVNDCPNLVNFGKEEGNNRQLMPCPVSTALAPTNNSSNNSSDIDCFSMAFPSLAHLNLLNCPLSESNLFRTFNYSTTLQELNLSESDIVSLPSCIKTFVQLRYLDLDNCKQLEEILQLPPNIEQVSAEGCMLLESFPQVSAKFQFNTYNLPELRLINLSSCPKMLINIGIPLPNPLLLEGHLPECNIILPGNRIPDWFDYCKETNSNSNSCEIDINGPLCLDEIAAIAFCAVVAPNPERNTYFIVSIKDIAIGEIEWFCSTNSDHVCLGYSVEKSLEIPQKYLDGDILRFTFDSDPIMKAIFKSCGIHVIFKHEKNVKDHAVDPMDGIQLISKRRRDECEHNMDPDDDWYSQQRRHFRYGGGTLLDDDFNEDLDLEL